jgi:hypothetical protein
MALAVAFAVAGAPALIVGACQSDRIAQAQPDKPVPVLAVALAASDGRPDVNVAPSQHARPMAVPAIDDAITLDASDAQVCVVRRGGVVACWGQELDVSGRIAATDFAARAIEGAGVVSAVRASGVSAVADRSGRIQPLCVRDAKGWRSREGNTWRPMPLPVSPLVGLGAKPRQVSRDQRCGVDRGERLVCGTRLPTGTRPGGPWHLWVAATKDHFVEATSLFFDQNQPVVCGRTTAEKVACFRVAEVAGSQAIASPTIEGLTGVAQVAAGGQGDDSTACARTRDGAVWCWGDGKFGQRGPAPPADRFQAVRIRDLPPLAELAVGGPFVCGREAAGGVYCWGSNRDGTAPDSTPPERR